MTRKLYEIAADIVEAQATMIEMPPDSLEQALSKVFVTLQRMKIAEDGGFLLDQAKPSEEPGQEVVSVDPKSSIHENKVICLSQTRPLPRWPQGRSTFPGRFYPQAGWVVLPKDGQFQERP